jgi:phytol kinase
MFLASTTAIFLVLILLPGSSLSPLAVAYGFNKAVLAAFVSGALATLAEGVSPHGTDNLSVPLVTAGAVWMVINNS